MTGKKSNPSVRSCVRTDSLRPEISSPTSRRALVLRQRGQELLEEAEQLVAVRAGVEEEGQDHRPSALGGKVEVLLRVELRRPETRGERLVGEARRRFVGLRGEPQRLADLLLDRGLGARLAGGELAQPEGHVALGIHAEQRDRHPQAQLLGDRGAGIVDDREVEALAPRELRRARAVRSRRDPDDLEVVLAAQRRDRLEGLRDDRRLADLGVEEEEQQALPEQIRDLEALVVERPAREGGERTLLGRARVLGRGGLLGCGWRIRRCRRLRNVGGGGGRIRGRRIRLLPAGDRDRKRQRRGESPESHGREHTQSGGALPYAARSRMWMPQALPRPITCVSPTFAPATWRSPASPRRCVETS